MIDFRFFFFPIIVVVQSLSHVWLFETPWAAACQAPRPSLSLGACSNSCPWVNNAIQPSHPLLVPSPAFNLSQHQGLEIQWVSFLYQVTNIESSASAISPSNEYSGLISFRIDQFDPLAVQGILKSLLQHQSLKEWILFYYMCPML